MAFLAVNYDVDAAVHYLRSHAGLTSTGHCARFVREAIHAGGIILGHTLSAKDYGPILRQAGFQVVPSSGLFQIGDVVVIQGFGKQSTPTGPVSHSHLHGHMAMFDGLQWISDFKQRRHSQPGYPGTEYDRAQPPFAVYRFPLQSRAK